MKKILTLGFLLEENRICLALKKRGFGEGYFNGFGGKVEKGETIEAGMVREILEESNVFVQEANLQKVIVNNFMFKDGRHLEVHTYFVRTWSGEPEETEEMRPSWFLYQDIPYETMWVDDPFWLPRTLRGEKLIGKIWFNEDGKRIEKMEWKNVETL